MDSYIQVISLVVSFIYGVLFSLLTKFNYFIIENRKVVFKFVVTLVFIVDVVILYIYLMYKINNGYFHIYFIIVVILGYSVMLKLQNKLKIICKKIVKKNQKK